VRDFTTSGVGDPESVEFNPETGTLYTVNADGDKIVEFSTSGALVSEIDISYLPLVRPSGLAYAPRSTDSTKKSFYISDRRIDNDADPSENDGRLYEVTDPGSDEPSPAGSVEARVAAGWDDAEESASGSVSRSGSDLELVDDGSSQTVGLRFTGLRIPAGASITNAYIKFTADETHSGATNLAIRGQDADDAATFSSTSRNISSRPRTGASLPWSPAPWVAGQSVDAQRTPDLASILQEVVDRPGWASGNSMVFTVTGSGRRTAVSWDSAAAKAPLLHVEYASSPPPPSTQDVAVAASSDDAEQASSGSVSRSSTDVDLGHGTVGLRFTGLRLPAGATVSRAYVQFTAAGAHSVATNLTIKAQDADNAATFSTASFNISSRARTDALAGWSPAAWSLGSAGASQRTPDLSALIQEVVNRPGWDSGNALAFIVTGSGHRAAQSFNGSAAKAPLLHVEWR
jgi:hypothetical protein